MGTVYYTVTRPGKTGIVSGSGLVYSSYIKASGKFTSTATSATFVDNSPIGSVDITLSLGDIIQLRGSEPMWFQFGGVAAVVGVGYYANAIEDVLDIEVGKDEEGKLSVIDEA